MDDNPILKKWFPKCYKAGSSSSSSSSPRPPSKFYLICFHNAGSAASIFTTASSAHETNPFVAHCENHGGALLACQFPGREERLADKREKSFQPYLDELAPALAALLLKSTTSSVPYALIGHSMGAWFGFELLKRLVHVHHVHLPAAWVVSCFCAPNVKDEDRPWKTVGRHGTEAELQDEARAWNVNEIVFEYWDVFGPMMRDDFCCFDEYEYNDDDAKDGNGCCRYLFDVPLQVYHAENDERITRHHVEAWRAFTLCDFTCLEIKGGNHLFVYDIPIRNAWMDTVLSHFPSSLGGGGGGGGDISASYDNMTAATTTMA